MWAATDKFVEAFFSAFLMPTCEMFSGDFEQWFSVRFPREINRITGFLMREAGAFAWGSAGVTGARSDVPCEPKHSSTAETTSKTADRNG